MSSLRGFVMGVGGLTLLDVVTQKGPADRLGGAFGLVSKVLTHWLDPYTPLIPDLRQGDNSAFGNGPSQRQ